MLANSRSKLDLRFGYSSVHGASGDPCLFTGSWLRSTCYFGTCRLEGRASPTKIKKRIDFDFLLR